MGYRYPVSAYTKCKESVRGVKAKGEGCPSCKIFCVGPYQLPGDSNLVNALVMGGHSSFHE